jgi:chitodextrinase
VTGFPRLTWTASTDNVGVAGYRIHRSTDGSFGLPYTETSATTFTDVGISEGVAYTYGVVAFDAAGNVSPRSTLRTTTAGQAPTAPTSLTAALVNSNSQVQLSWVASTDNVGVVEYIVYRSTTTNVQGPEVGRTPTPGWIDTSVQSGVRYTYTVRARDTFYTSGRSNFRNITVP